MLLCNTTMIYLVIRNLTGRRNIFVENNGVTREGVLGVWDTPYKFCRSKLTLFTVKNK